jgi:hypothetical protein
MGMRWSKKDEAALKKSVNNYNSKVNRLSKKKNVDKRVIPEKISYKKLRNEIEDRSIFKDQLKINKAFTSRGGETITLKRENGIVVTKYREFEINTKIDRINKEREKLKKHYQNFMPLDRGVIQQGKLSEFSVGANNITPIEFNPEKMYNFNMNMYIRGLDEYYDSQEKLNNIYVENFKDSLESAFSGKVLEKIKELFKEIPDQLIIDTYYTDETLNIDFNYEMESYADGESAIEEFYKGWSRVNSMNKGVVESDDTILNRLYDRE